jgi:hypothetical protein
VTSQRDGSQPGLPAELSPAEPLRVEVERKRQIELRRYTVRYDPCTKPVNMGPNEAYASKPQVVSGGHALFPELALLQLFQREGWKGVWADSHHKKYFSTMPNRSKGITLDPLAARVVLRIASEQPKAATGAWDLMLWHEKLVLFVLTRPPAAAPRLRRMETEWLEGALKAGLSENQFLVVEWDFKPRRAVKVVHGPAKKAVAEQPRRRFMRKASPK